MEGDGMQDRNWFGAFFPAEVGVGFVQSLFAPLFRAATPARNLTAASTAAESRIADAGADASWTASLHRGDGLPPFLLCIRNAAGANSAMRFEPFGSRADANSLGRDH
jgi:hypothetical protein